MEVPDLGDVLEIVVVQPAPDVSGARGQRLGRVREPHGGLAVPVLRGERRHGGHEAPVLTVELAEGRRALVRLETGMGAEALLLPESRRILGAHLAESRVDDRRQDEPVVLEDRDHVGHQPAEGVVLTRLQEGEGLVRNAGVGIDERGPRGLELLERGVPVRRGHEEGGLSE